MFRKIHSNRDTQDTLLSELNKEFGIYIGKFKNWFTAICLRYPKQVYSLMVILLLSSFVLSFLLFQTEKPNPQISGKQNVSQSKPSPIQDGFGQIMQKSMALKEAIALKTQVEGLLAQDSLSKADSAALGKAIDRLHELSISKSISQ